jgi:general secretion pathway protein E
VGEIRDGETASIAMQAALSGHLIFSTLHSPGTAGVFSRLIEMGVEPFLASSCVSSVLSQRLLRVVCGQCARASAPDEGLRKEFESYGIAADTVMHGVGCEACGGTGYSGRTGIFELLALTPTLREAVHRKTPYRVLHKAARDEGLRTLRRDGLEKIALGLTTFEEIARVCPPEED